MRHFSLFLALLFLVACGGKDEEQGGAKQPDAQDMPAITAERQKPLYFAESNPEYLSDWRIFYSHDEDGQSSIMPQEYVVPYTLSSPLFSDYALKYRTISLPKNQSGKAHGYIETDLAQKRDDSAVSNQPLEDWIDFPIGTVVSKTFYYPVADHQSTDKISVRKVTGKEAYQASLGKHFKGNPVKGIKLDGYRLIETRILVHRPSGWVALPYIWNDEQTNAKLSRFGSIIPMELDEAGVKTAFEYEVPNQNQCAGCHATNNTTREIMPIGLKPRHLDVPIYSFFHEDFPSTDQGKGQLELFYDSGIISSVTNFTSNVAWDDATASLDARARAYLDINCSHCHNKVGPADTSGLLFEPSNQDLTHLGRCKNPIAAGQGTGGHKYDIVPGRADESILIYRMNSRDPAERMPELGRALVHDEGVALLRDWVNEMAGDCEG